MLIRRKKREPNDFIQYQFVFLRAKIMILNVFVSYKEHIIVYQIRERKDNNKKKIKG